MRLGFNKDKLTKASRKSQARRWLIERLESRQCLAVTSLVHDINQTLIPLPEVEASEIVQIGNVAYFRGTSQAIGAELWKTDGTAAGTTLVADINPGTSGSYPKNLTNVNGTLFFSAFSSNGYKLWKTDGTVAGTSLVKDVRTGNAQFPAMAITANFGMLNGSSSRLGEIGDSSAGSKEVELYRIELAAGAQITAETSLPENATSFDTYLRLFNESGAQVAFDDDSGSDLYSRLTYTAPSQGIYYLGVSGYGNQSYNIITGTGTLDGRTGEYALSVQTTGNGAASSSSSGFVNANGTLYFRANDGTSGYELWKSDGTTDGTVMVADLQQGSASSRPREIVNLNGVVYFSATAGSKGYELWKSDGTAAGTVRVKDIRSGTESSLPRNLKVIGDELYFTANDGTAGEELWKTDGTEAGTLLVKDILVGTGSSIPFELTDVSGVLYFSAYDSVAGRELWKSDGTADGTSRLVDLNVGINSSNARLLVNFNGSLAFIANDVNNDGVNDGNGLWVSNGTEAGTSLIKSFGVETAGSFNVSELTNVNGTMYFAADSDSGIEVWTSDGTNANTSQLIDIAPGAQSSWPGTFVPFGSSTLFLASLSSGRQIWITNGTALGTVALVSYLTDSSEPGSTVGKLTAVNGRVYFAANDGVSGVELWKTDGTSSETVRVEDIQSGFGGSTPNLLTNVNGTLFFTAKESVYGAELWKTDGTANNTVLVKNINSSFSYIAPSNLTNVGGKLFFTATDGLGGVELWKSDGTNAGTVRVKDIRVGSSDSSPKYLTNVNGTLYFTATDGTKGVELWKSDGTAAGTVLVKDIYLGINGSSPKYLTNVNGTLMFVCNDGTSGVELWKSDGTTAGTVRVRDIVAGSGGSSPTKLTNVNGTVYFSAQSSGGRELWKSNGTLAGTVRVKDINGAGSSFPSNLTNANGKLFFSAFEAAYGNELWVTNGTEAGTVRLRDINPGAASSAQSDHVNINGVVFFSANDGTRGFELWRSDGTDVGTFLVSDISSASNSAPDQFTFLNNRLLYAASTIETGRELWSTYLGLEFSGVGGSVGQGNHVSYVENSSPKQIAPQGKLVDLDSPTYMNGQIVVQLTTNAQADDRISIRTAGLVSTDSSNRVRYNGVIIGTFTGGSGTAPLTITFNSNSTMSYAQSVLRNIVYSTVSDNPSTLTRSYSVTVNRGIESFTESNQIVVTRANDAPTLGSVSGSIAGGTNIAYVENGASVPIAGLGTVTDPDSLNFAGGNLTVRFTANANSTDRLSVRNSSSQTVVGNEVRHQGVAFATFTGGVGTSPLVFTFNSSATPGKVQLLLRNIVYSNTSDNPTTSPRTFQAQMTDGDGGTSLARTNQITITRTNDAPTLANFGGALSYARNAASIQVSSTATVVDPDSSNFSGGVLTVSITQGSNASNQILVSGGGFSWDASNNLLRNGVIIGTRNAGGGLGTTEMKITLRSTANASVVQDLMRAVRFKTVGSTSIAQRVIAVKLTDGDGGTSNTVSKAINIV